MESIIQSDFRGGLNLFDSDINLAQDEYVLGFNIRNRTGSIEPVKKHVEDTNAPSGFKQGLYAFDKYLLLFCNGLAYYKDTTLASPVWTKINTLFVDAFVDYIYVQAIPASSFNYLRKLDSNEQISGSPAIPTINVNGITVNGTIAGAVVQDGIHQPWLIKADGTVKLLQTYLEWSLDIREYVPIGLNMAYTNGILIIASSDKKKFFRSVSGRPLDFAVNVDTVGAKGGDANTVSYAASYEDIKCLIPLNSGELLVGSQKVCYPIEFNYETTIFQEPTFLNLRPFLAGVINQFSFIDTLGDYAFIDIDGIRSFNAVSSLKNEGRNSVFSARIARAFVGITQPSTTAAIVFDNYSLFSVKTIYSDKTIAVYDNTRQRWVSFDISKDLDGPIKQFAIVTEFQNPVLYGITKNKVFKMYSSSNYEEAALTSKGITTGMSKPELKIRSVRAAFEGSRSESIVTVRSIVNNRKTKRVRETLSNTLTGIIYPAEYPVTYFHEGDIDNLHFNFERISSHGWKVGSEIKWQNNAKLSLIQHDIDGMETKTPVRQQSQTYKET